MAGLTTSLRALHEEEQEIAWLLEQRQEAIAENNPELVRSLEAQLSAIPLYAQYLRENPTAAE
jgi:hypothetical protein